MVSKREIFLRRSHTTLKMNFNICIKGGDMDLLLRY